MALIIVIRQTDTSILNQSAPGPPLLSSAPLSVFVCSALSVSSPAGGHRYQLCLTQRKVSPAWLASLLPSTRVGRPNIPLCCRTEHHIYIPASYRTWPNISAGHQTCPPKLPNISCTYTDTVLHKPTDQRVLHTVFFTFLYSRGKKYTTINV